MKRYLWKHAMSPLTRDKNGSFVSAHGEKAWICLDEFIEKIAKGNHCFLCGEPPGSKKFNNEHVIPDWVIQHFSLSKAKVRLMNGKSVKYSRSYGIDCCEDCNTLMSNRIEGPLSKAVKSQSLSSREIIFNQNEPSVYVWMALVFLKLHLKDKTLRWNLDHNQPEGMIGDRHQWEYLHHLHALIRAYFLGYHIDPKATGSFFAIHLDPMVGEPFDFQTIPEHSAMMLKLDGWVFLAVFDDCTACLGQVNKRLSKIKSAASLSFPQCLEVFSELVALNKGLVTRPEFFVVKARCVNSYTVTASFPDQCCFGNFDSSLRDQVLQLVLTNRVGHATPEDQAEFELRIKSGNQTFFT